MDKSLARRRTDEIRDETGALSLTEINAIVFDPGYSAHRRHSGVVDTVLCYVPAATLSIAIASAGFDAQRGILIIGASCCCLFGLRHLRSCLSSRVAIALLLSLWVLGALSTALSPIPGWSFADFATYSLLFDCIGLQAKCYAKLSRTARQRFALFSVIIVCSAALSATLPIALMARLTGSTLPWPEPLGGFGNPRFFNQFQTWVLPLLPCFIIAPQGDSGEQSRALIRCLAACLLIGLWIFYFRSDGRGTAYALFVGTVLASLIRLPGAARLGALSLGAAVVGYFLASALFPGTALAERLGSGALNGRAPLWRHAIEMAMSHPFLGAGPMMFAAQPGMSAAHPHNLILLWASEYGFPFTLTAIALVVFSLVRWIRFVKRGARGDTANTARTYWHTALSIALIATLTHAMVSGLTIMPISQLAMILVIGMALGEYKTDPPSSASRSSRLMIGSRAFVSASVLASALYLTVFVVTGASWVHSARVGDVSGQQLKPRFWDDGQLTLLNARDRR